MKLIIAKLLKNYKVLIIVLGTTKSKCKKSFEICTESNGDIVPIARDTTSKTF